MGFCPCYCHIGLAYQALRSGGTAPAILNAANEIAVEAFLNGKISFLSIPRLIEEVLVTLPAVLVKTLNDVMEADATARRVALEWLCA